MIQDKEAKPVNQEGPSVEYYLGHIAAYEREFKPWEQRVQKIITRYRDEKRDRTGARFNILWSNTQTLKAATFSRLPQPDVSRRYKDNDPIGRVASLILERALEFEVEHYKEFGASLRQTVYDRFLGGRGVAWERYDPTIQSEQATEDQQPVERLTDERTATDYVHWRDFGHSVARTWEEVQIVWRRVYLTRNACVQRFGDEGKAIPLDASPEELVKTRGNADAPEYTKRALVYEIWDKETGKALWLSKSLGKILDVKDDPLGLEEFFPCPPPIYATLTTDSLVPLPDFTMYQDQATELDILSDRIDGLVKALQLKGVYDASVPELARLFTEGQNGTLIPAKNWAAFAEKNGLQGAVNLVEILPIAQALGEAYKAFEQVKSQIYELTGISDIIRGETQASETATAQQIKNSYASMRLKTYQDEVERFAARLLNIKAQIICAHFDDATILRMSSADQLAPQDQQLIPQAMAMLRDRVTRSFRIEISTDSMVYQDEQQTKQDRMEFLEVTSTFLEKLVQTANVAPQILPLGVELLKFGASGFRVGKNIEGVIDTTGEQLKAFVQQQMSNPQPNPEQMKVQAQQQIEGARLQADQQKQQMQTQHDAAIEQMRQQHEQQMEAMKQQGSQASEQQKLAYQAQCDELQRQHDAAIAAQQMEFDRWKAQLDADTKVLVAEISAKTSLQTAAMSASTQDEEMGEDGTKRFSAPLQEILDTVNKNMADMMESIKAMQEESSQPATLIRDPTTGQAVGIQRGSKTRSIKRGADGSIVGVQ